MRFDLLILGDTPDAWCAAEAAARLGRRTAVLRHDREGDGGEAGVAAILSVYGPASQVEVAGTQTPHVLWQKAVARHERSISEACRAYGIRSWRGPVRLTDTSSAEVAIEGDALAFEADRMLIATGSAARRPTGVEHNRRVLVPEDAARLSESPETLLVIGGNRTARAFAQFFMAAGSAVSLIDAPGGFGLENALAEGLRVVAGEVATVGSDRDAAQVRLTDRRQLVADAVLFAADRPGATAGLRLDTAGLEPDEHGRLWCDDEGHTWVRGISAAGEVVGYPRWLPEDAAAAGEIVRALFESPVTQRRALAATI